MKIGDARSIYGTQIREYQEQKLALAKQREQMQIKINAAPDGAERFSQEAATLELTYDAVSKKQEEYQGYMEKLLEQWASAFNMEVSKQQGEAMQEYGEDTGKLIEVARRIMKGAVVPAADEKKLMDFNMELYQAAKNMGAMEKMRKKKTEEYDTLWDEEGEREESPDPMETADNTEALEDGPEIISVEDLMASVSEE